MQINLTSDQADTLRDVISDGEAPALVLNVGQGHSGFGLYAWEEDYPEAGATLIAPMESLTGAQPAPAAPSEHRVERWRNAAFAFERRAMRVEAALRLALKELSNQSRSGYVKRAMDVLRAEDLPAAQPADSAMEVLIQAAKAILPAMAECQEIARRWEPDDSSGKERQWLVRGKDAAKSLSAALAAFDALEKP